MVSQQVLRVLARSRLRHGLTAAAIVAVVALPAAAAHAEDTLLIDLRSGDAAKLKASRDALRDGLAKVQNISVLSGGAMNAALRGETYEPLIHSGKASMTAAALAYGRLDCANASRAATQAIVSYAALQARKRNVRDELRRAYVYKLLCANNGKNADGARTAVARLRALGFTSAPQGVAEDVWTKYSAPIKPPVPIPGSVPAPVPAAPATGELEIKQPAGATVWIDHKPRGKAPLSVKLPVGEHVVAVVNGDGAAARLTKVKAGHTSIVMVVQSADPKWEPIRASIAGWKTAGKVGSTTRMAEILRRLSVRFAFVMLPGKVEVWGVQKFRRMARRLGEATRDRPVQLGGLVNDHASAWDGRSPDPSLPLLTEKNTPKRGHKPQKWWVYASIIGAVAVGAAVIIANDASTDSQRIRLTFP